MEMYPHSCTTESPQSSRPVYVKQPLKITALNVSKAGRVHTPKQERVCCSDQTFGVATGDLGPEKRRMYRVWSQSSNKSVITQKCQIFRPVADSTEQPAAAAAAQAWPTHCKSSQQQHKALWVYSNKQGSPIKVEFFWILTMPTEIWSRTEPSVCGYALCLGSQLQFFQVPLSAHLWPSTQATKVGSVCHFGKCQMVSPGDETGLQNGCTLRYVVSSWT